MSATNKERRDAFQAALRDGKLDVYFAELQLEVRMSTRQITPTIAKPIEPAPARELPARPVADRAESIPVQRFRNACYFLDKAERNLASAYEKGAPWAQITILRAEVITWEEYLQKALLEII